MGEPLKLTGMVLSAMPVSEYDKRVVILTKERGKLAAFARGARRTASPLLAPCNPFSFGSFVLYEGRNSYTLVQADISNYFLELKEDFAGTCYGIYFMEVADYYTRENLDGGPLLNLLYVSLKALANQKLDNELVRTVFEMKAMILNGEYPFDVIQDPRLQEATRYALAYVANAQVGQLYTFTLKPEILAEFKRVQQKLNQKNIDRPFKSLEILKTLLEV
ncbi:MAG TPA: DNA repair protein RecO [Candidatus Choladousia intestinigallinarum]|nr:DNA repair protein RecO [Candidatus Choladousia intestinigallinarum]